MSSQKPKKSYAELQGNLHCYKLKQRRALALPAPHFGVSDGDVKMDKPVNSVQNMYLASYFCTSQLKLKGTTQQYRG